MKKIDFCYCTAAAFCDALSNPEEILSAFVGFFFFWRKNPPHVSFMYLDGTSQSGPVYQW